MERRTVYQGHSDYITLSDISACSGYFSFEEVKEMEKKLNEIVGNMIGISNAENRAFAEKIFRLGYIAAHFNYGLERS